MMYLTEKEELKRVSLLHLVNLSNDVEDESIKNNLITLIKTCRIKVKNLVVEGFIDV